MGQFNWGALGRLLAVAGISSVVVACGGGSGGGGGISGVPPSQQSAAPPPASSSAAPATSVDVSLDPALPAASRERISAIATATGSSADGRGISVPADIADNTFLSLALTTDKQAVLMGFVRRAGTTLSAETTMLALLRLMWGVQPQGYSPALLEGSLKAAAAYPAALALVRKTLNEGGIPHKNGDVIALLNDVLQQSEPTSSPKSSSEAAQKSLAAVPAILFEDSGTNFKVSIVSATSAAAVLENATPISWAAERLNEDGSSLFKLSRPLDPMTLTSAAADVPSQATLGGGTATRYKVRLHQTPQSHAATGAVIAQELLSVVLGLTRLSPQAVELGKAAENVANAYAANGDKSGKDFFQGLLTDILLGNMLRIYQMTSGWQSFSISNDFLSGVQDAAWEGLLKNTPALKNVRNAYEAGSIFTKLRLAMATASFDDISDVCLDEKGALVLCSGIFEGPVTLSGPATSFNGTCTGTYTIVGTATLTVGPASTLTIVGTERIAQTCYNAQAAAAITLAMVSSPSGFVGASTTPFTCAAPCNSGSIEMSASLTMPSAANGAPTATGTMRVVNSNMSPFRGDASGTLALALKP